MELLYPLSRVRSKVISFSLSLASNPETNCQLFFLLSHNLHCYYPQNHVKNACLRSRGFLTLLNIQVDSVRGIIEGIRAVSRKLIRSDFS